MRTHRSLQFSEHRKLENATTFACKSAESLEPPVRRQEERMMPPSKKLEVDHDGSMTKPLRNYQPSD